VTAALGPDLARHTSEIVTSIVSIAVTLVVAWAFWKVRQPKRLAWVPEINTPVVSEQAMTAASKLRVYWEEDPAHPAAKLVDPRLVLLRIVNAGMQDIASEDFRTGTAGQNEWTPITISISGGEIYSADVIEKSENVVATAEDFTRGHASRVSFSTGLLRKAEWFKVQLLVDGAADELQVDARLRGQTRLPREFDIKEARVRKLAWYLAGACTLLCLTLAGVAWAVYTKPTARQVTTLQYHYSSTFPWWAALTILSAGLAVTFGVYAIAIPITGKIRRAWKKRKRVRDASRPAHGSSGSDAHQVDRVP
jgi:hypothetical protein